MNTFQMKLKVSVQSRARLDGAAVCQSYDTMYPSADGQTELYFCGCGDWWYQVGTQLNVIPAAVTCADPGDGPLHQAFLSCWLVAAGYTHHVILLFDLALKVCS